MRTRHCLNSDKFFELLRILAASELLIMKSDPPGTLGPNPFKAKGPSAIRESSLAAFTSFVYPVMPWFTANSLLT
jgi:hypothetical protein